MREQANKLKNVELELSKKYGSFELFALVLRADAPDKWDLLISSDWAREDKKSAIDRVVSSIQPELSQKELMMLSRIIVLDKHDSALKALHSAMDVEHGLAEITDSEFFGLAIKHAYLITSKRKKS